MKISKKTLVYLGTGIYVIIVGALGFVVYQQIGEKETINQELTVTRSNLERISPDNLNREKQALEIQLTEVESQAENLKTMLSQGKTNVAASSIVFEVAKHNGVEVIDLTSPIPTYDVLEGVPCTVVVLDTTVRGDVRDLVEFITDLNSYLPTGMIQSVEMNIQEETDNSSSAVLFVVYNYQGE